MLNNVTLVFVGTLVEYVKCLSNILKVLSNVHMIYMCIYIYTFMMIVCYICIQTLLHFLYMLLCCYYSFVFAVIPIAVAIDPFWGWIARLPIAYSLCSWHGEACAMALGPHSWACSGIKSYSAQEGIPSYSPHEEAPQGNRQGNIITL